MDALGSRLYLLWVKFFVGEGKSMDFIGKATGLYAIWVRFLNALQGPFLLIIRAYIGYRFFMAGLGKFQNFSNVVGFFSGLGIPMPEVNAAMAASTELVGGALLLLGLGSRIATVPLTFTMIVAYLTAHSKALENFWSDQSPFFKQEPFPFLMVCLIVLLFGPGKYSLDNLFCKKKV